MKTLEQVASDPELLEVARKAVEDELIAWREARISQLRGNGLVIKEPDGTPSPIIRFGMETAMRIGLEAIIKHLGMGEGVASFVEDDKGDQQ